MDMLKTRIVSNVTRLLDERSTNAKKLCRETGLSYGTMRRALGDRDEGMSTRSLVAISTALGVDPHELTAPVGAE